MPAKQHISYFDFLRGLAIVMVVGIHTWTDVASHKLDGPVEDSLALIVRNFFNCAVPLFLAMSGFFIGKKKLDNWGEIGSFWKKQIPTVYLPCLIFSLPWFTISYISTDCEMIRNFVNLLLCGYSVYYFIALIIECYLLTPVLLKINNVQGLVLVSAISIVAMTGFELIRFAGGRELPLIVYGSFPPLLIFYFIGIYLSRHSRDFSLWIPCLMIVVGIVLGLCHMQWLRSEYGVSGEGQKVSLMLFDAGIILLAMSSKVERMYRDNFITRIILYIVEISFGIYFTHIYFIDILNRFVPQLHASWIVMTVVSIAATIAFIAVVKRICPTWSRRFLGYR